MTKLTFNFLLLLFCSRALASDVSPRMSWVEVHGQRFYVEVAADASSRSRGLMNRDKLEQNHGMLFIFPEARVMRFWMKDTLIPLDIIYLDNQLRVINMALGAQPCGSDPCPSFLSKGRAKYVLEINAGMATKIGLHAGDVVHFEQVTGK